LILGANQVLSFLNFGWPVHPVWEKIIKCDKEIDAATKLTEN